MHWCHVACGAPPLWVSMRGVGSQEEPMNMGGYAHVAPRLQTCMREEGRQLPDHVPYAGRGPAASTATGFGSVHKQEQVRHSPPYRRSDDTSRRN